LILDFPHQDAATFIANRFNNRLGVFGEGLGGFVAFYLALAHGPMRSIVCQNAPALLTEPAFYDAMTQGSNASARRRRAFLPLLAIGAKVVPGLRLPISLYLDWKELIDPKPANRALEARLVVQGYLRDPDFDRWYRLSSIMSQVSTPPPQPLAELTTPTMFLVPVRGWSDPSYLHDLYKRLPAVRKRLVEVDGSVYWMLSHPREAAGVICDWFKETL
jgi:pimeloyl-ACP methyl ester carboxylesterase